MPTRKKRKRLKDRMDKRMKARNVTIRRRAKDDYPVEWAMIQQIIQAYICHGENVLPEAMQFVRACELSSKPDKSLPPPDIHSLRLLWNRTCRHLHEKDGA